MTESTRELVDGIRRGDLTYPELVIAAVGHTDLTGSSVENSDLSWERAAAVQAFLLDRGVSEAQVTTHGAGDSSPLDEGSTDAIHAANRRVDFWVHDG